MLTYIGMLLVGLGVILVGAELFTNGIEWLGKKMRLSEGCVGSILAAVGTALPETLVPIIAIGFGSSAATDEIGIGAILGAPFMLGTLALFVTGAAALIFAMFGRRRTTMLIDETVMKRDLRFFLAVYSMAIAASLLADHRYKVVLACGLLLAYGFYVYQTIRTGECVVDTDINPLLMARRQANPRLRYVLLQVMIALGCIVGGAEMFVHTMEKLATALRVSPFILSVIITPIATELPEKFNSVLWISRGKDTLALGNITGAMVFQSSVIPAIGIVMTPWVLTPAAFTSAAITLGSIALIFIYLQAKGYLRAYTLLSGGMCYALFLFLILGHKI